MFLMGNANIPVSLLLLLMLLWLLLLLSMSMTITRVITRMGLIQIKTMCNHYKHQVIHTPAIATVGLHHHLIRDNDHIPKLKLIFRHLRVDTFLVYI